MNLVFYDLETTIQPKDMIEFGAIILDKQSLLEKENFSTLIHSDQISNRSIDYNGITPKMVQNAPMFA